MIDSRSLRTALVAVVAATGLSGCLRQTGAPAIEPRRPVSDGPADDAKITETDRVGGSFILDGKPFCFLGTNNYYVTFKSKKMTDDVLESAKAMAHIPKWVCPSTSPGVTNPPTTSWRGRGEGAVRST